MDLDFDLDLDLGMDIDLELDKDLDLDLDKLAANPALRRNVLLAIALHCSTLENASTYSSGVFSRPSFSGFASSNFKSS